MRKCTVCKEFMLEGYINENQLEYFCSDEHLEQHYPGQLEIQNNMTDDDLEDSAIYWTAWEDRVENVQAALEEIPEVDTEEEREELYAFIQEQFQTDTNGSETPTWYQVFLIHDNIYFNKRFAELFEDGKDQVKEQYIILQPGEEVTEGACNHELFDSFWDAHDRIKEDEEAAK